MFSAKQLALQLGVILFLWNLTILGGSFKGSRPPSKWECFRSLIHLLPPVFLYLFAWLADQSTDPALVWFYALFVFRYYKTVISVYYWFQYKPAVAVSIPTYTPDDCTVILPTAGPNDRETFVDSICAILMNKPKHVIIATATEKVQELVKTVLAEMISKNGQLKYQLEHNLGKFEVPVSAIQVINCNAANKRIQFLTASRLVKTKLIASVDDSAVWGPRLLLGTLPAFDDSNVGLVGTKKWVKRLEWKDDPTKSCLANWLGAYWQGFSNTLFALYLIRHNFEIQSSNAADGGVFCVSGRTAFLRSQIVRDPEFEHDFLNEYAFDFCGFKRGANLAADDDLFIVRWVTKRDWTIKMQLADDATVTITMKATLQVFVQKCLRWSRTIVRQNPKALFGDRVIWYKWPITVWTTYLPWMWNASLLWDPALVITLLRTAMYKQSMNKVSVILALVGFIYATKLIKTVPWFWANPDYFFLYFFPIPLTPLFSHFHSLLKIWTYITAIDTSWSGRKLPPKQS
ncbi:glycosyltransferase family 2 protein [Periconia macrospinosa]|uniref:Glycosyltransferase family 2 protein n=1 Tax=Periconia macrospinosa TaxID=97972 RepID=A0A2V1DPP8_9PLEO|nr:glycosyltransferase family 2 protein [Periconia macrospinosa]